MILERKSFLIIFICHILVIVALYAIFWNVIKDRFILLEKQSAIHKVIDLKNHFLDERQNIDKLANDWGIWDDTYGFLQDRNDDYIKSNLNKISFEIIDVNLIGLLNKNNEIYYLKLLDKENNKFIPIPESFKNKLTENKNLLTFKKSGKNNDGIIKIGGKNYLFAARPVLKSDKTGPTTGSIIMARIIDNKMLLKINNNNNEIDYIKLINYSDDALNKYGLTSDKEPYITHNNENTFVYDLIRDFYNNPAFIMEVKIPRKIYKQSRDNINQLLIYLLILTIIFDAITLLILEKKVLGRFNTVKNLIESIRETGDIETSIKGEKLDDLTKLSNGIHNILKELKESRDAHKAIYNGAIDGMLLIDINTEKIIRINSIFSFLTNYSKNDTIGKNINEINSSKLIKSIINSFKRSPNQTKLFKRAEIFHKKDGTEFYTDIGASIISYENAQCLMLIIRDITEKKKVEDELEDKRQNLENLVNERTKQLRMSYLSLQEINLELIEANNHKNKFLSTMSHELRTPLNAILGFTSLLHKEMFGPLNKKQKEYVQLVSEGGKHLLSLIEDLLNLTKIDAGSIEFQPETFTATKFLEEAVCLMKPEAEKKNIKLEYKSSLNGSRLFADKRKCKQIIINLLSNAIKFTDHNGEVSVEARNLNSQKIQITVKDNGTGIDPKDQDRIFEEFYQTDATRDQALGGSGIGLAITKRLVEIHNGEIYVESEPGKGSKFYIILPTTKIR